MKLAPLARWGLPAAILASLVLVGAALAVTVYSTYSLVAGASDTLIRGQADVLEHTVRASLDALGRQPESSDLAELLADQQDEGLRLVAVLDREGNVQAQAGDLVPGSPPLATFRSDALMGVGDRVRVVIRAPRGRGRGRAPGQPRTAGVLVEFVPKEAEALRAAAQRTLAIGGLATLVLLAVALGLVRSFLRRAAEERERERDRRLASLGQLSAVLAHEIRNPLASLKGNAQLLASMLPEGEKPRGKANRVVEEAVRLEVLTNDLLEFARTGEIHRVATDPRALLADAAAAVGPDVTVASEGAPASWPLDPDRVRQVLVNLLQNAVQAGPPVRASVGHDAGGLRFEVRDAGPGVPAEDLDRLFEPFFTKKTRGTGLGLAVVRRVVDLHGGSIRVANGPEGGAVFTVVLPGA